MFRAAQANPFDEAVAKATDENLTSENWEFILDVCDRVSTAETGGKDAVASMIKRLAHRNANVQLYTLELANALSQNCGIKIHKELASRSFTDALLRLAGDRNTHQQVKAKILERMEEWTEMFSKDPDLGIMEQAYMRLKSQNPNLQPPSKPFKQEITDSDRRKEEEELQMALALSIKDKPADPSGRKQSQAANSAGGSSAAQPQAQPGPLPSGGTTAATVSRVRALFDFVPSEPGELQFRKGDIIAVLESVYKDWWKGSLRGQEGIFPLNYVEKLQDPTEEEMQRDAQTEAEVFAEIKNVEKLLALLSTSEAAGPRGGDVRENEEITTLYHSTLAIRPKLIELIGKYSQKKDDFTQLNEKFIKARRDYEALLEQSMSHVAQPPSYGRPPPPQQAYNQSYPPPQQQHAYGAPPPRQDSDPYYSQGPPPQRQQSYPPPQATGPAPFYFQPPGAQPLPQQQSPTSMHPPPLNVQHHPSSSPPPPQSAQPPYHTPSSYPPPAAAAPNRASVASAQELAANPTGNTYEPVAENPYAPPSQSGHQPPPQPNYAAPSAPPPQGEGGYGSPPPPHGAYAPPGQGGGYGGSYSSIAPQHSGRSSYQPYAPPGATAAAGGPSGSADGRAGDVSDYYR